MDQAALHEEDIHAWSRHQARVLRGLAGAGLRLPDDLDLERVAQEIEDMVHEQRFAAESNLLQALVHLMKTVALPEDGAVRHWTAEADAFLLNAARRHRPSTRRVIDGQELWADARRSATRYLETNGHEAPPLPASCPFDLDELVGGEADPRQLAARLSSAAADQASTPGA